MTPAPAAQRKALSPRRQTRSGTASASLHGWGRQARPAPAPVKVGRARTEDNLSYHVQRLAKLNEANEDDDGDSSSESSEDSALRSTMSQLDVEDDSEEEQDTEPEKVVEPPLAHAAEQAQHRFTVWRKAAAPAAAQRLARAGSGPPTALGQPAGLRGAPQAGRGRARRGNGRGALPPLREETKQGQPPEEVQDGALPLSSIPAASAAAAARACGAAAPAAEQPAVIFDWDDTLLPTWFITEVVCAAGPKPHRGYEGLPEDSPFAEALARHAQLVAEVLATACGLARVAIVTLAARPWVEDSASWFLPGLDLPALLRKLGIRVVYARECVPPRQALAASVEEGVDVYTIAKRNAMKRCLKRLRCGHNVLSIGDSQAEECAIKEILWEEDAGSSLCKTVKLLEDPTLDTLGMELQLVCSWLELMVPHKEDFHLDIEKDSGEIGNSFVKPDG
eukprot:CAMPEP_0168377502 /NCGR_PEP_ID=MMETSP0228-20121227/10857_1 /TAXON_ID=133427 /ORGANISM="Protoceratium reticulatum, Strain CCCM 535 (=CCMP 1889)" /LENGTH=449 /DNA_ID=CAMNT_0008390497 /DNA_START=164 /DNA_END=1513 /DNA_ORIENTATION=+